MNPISSWTAVAAEELKHTDPLKEITHAGYLFTLYIINDSLWLTAAFKSGKKVAFRLAFSPGEALVLKDLRQEAAQINLMFENPCSTIQVKLRFPEQDSPVFHYQTSIRSAFPMLIPFWPKDMLPLDAAGKLQKEGTVHVQQIGTRSGLMYFSMPSNSGSVFYFQNLSSLNEFCGATKTSAGDLVGGTWPELGFSLPAATTEPLPANQTFTVSDAYVRLSDEVPSGDLEITRSFMDHLAAVYLMLPRPEAIYHEWRETAEKGLEGLANHKGCWTFAGGHPYLNAYLCDYKTPPEIMVQLAVLMPMLEYCDWKGEEHRMAMELRDGLSGFLDKELGTVVRWLPALAGNLDKSEEQKQERVMDSWYLHHPLMNLGRLADRGDKTGAELVKSSVEYAIRVAKHFKYEWPVFYRMDTLEVLKAETQPGKGGEKDVPGAYAKLMLEYWRTFGGDKYLGEAKKAVRKLKGLGFDVFYQANNTAFSAVALLRLYKETKEQWYLDLSYVCIASIFKNVQLWDCDYGNGKSFPTFFSVFPLNDAPYTAAYEEQEVYATLHGYLQEADGVEIIPSVRLLISEFVRHAIARMPYYFPPMLPVEVLSDSVKTGEIDPALWVPLEDITDGWQQSGEVGQEVYGACLSFGIVPRQYIKVPGKDWMIFADYPFTDLKQSVNTLTFRLLGDGRLDCRLLLLDSAKKKITVQVSAPGKRSGGTEMEAVSKKKGAVEYRIPGDGLVKVKY